jgi:hypothetical protein
MRRVLLGRVRYHLYYVVVPEEEAVDVLALWHTARGTGPNPEASDTSEGRPAPVGP